MVGDFDDQTRQDEILLDLFELWPRHVLLPVREFGLGDHRSCSMLLLATTRHRRSWSPAPWAGESAR